MSRESVFILLLTAGPLLWMAGGTFWNGFRRFVLPAVIIASLLLTQVVLWKAVACGLVTLVANHMGYGDDNSGLERVLAFTFSGLGACVISLAFYWPLATLAVGIGGMALSKKVPWFTWKVVESAMGLAQTGVIVLAVVRG